jgi:hypothetical protein
MKTEPKLEDEKAAKPIRRSPLGSSKDIEDKERQFEKQGSSIIEMDDAIQSR